MYEAAFRAWSDLPWFHGIGWNSLDGDGAPSKRTDDLFQGKIGERVIRAWHLTR